MINIPQNINTVTILEEILTEGHSPLKIIAEDGGVYYVKNTRGRYPDYNIINEYVCSFLLHFWNIPTPKVANVKIDKYFLENSEYTSSHKPHYYNLPTFGSKNITNAVEMNQFFRIKTKRDYNKFSNPKDLLKIGLFDIWVENTDRKPTNNNILFQHEKKTITIIALDHAFTFDSMSYSDLNPNFVVNTWNDNILATDFAKGLYSWIKKEYN